MIGSLSTILHTQTAQKACQLLSVVLVLALDAPDRDLWWQKGDPHCGLLASHFRRSARNTSW